MCTFIYSVVDQDYTIVLMDSVRHSVYDSTTSYFVDSGRKGWNHYVHIVCMAALGKACLHIVALLFAAEIRNQLCKRYVMHVSTLILAATKHENNNFASILSIDITTSVKKKKISKCNPSCKPKKLYFWELYFQRNFQLSLRI